MLGGKREKQALKIWISAMDLIKLSEFMNHTIFANLIKNCRLLLLTLKKQYRMYCASGILLGGEDEINYLAVIILLLSRSCPYGLIV